MCRKSSRGRQKVEMTRMSKESNLLVTFSKRRSGLFKKASELSILCGAEIAIIVFSPAKKVFSFGHPSVDSIVNRYLTPQRNPDTLPPTALQLVEAHRTSTVQELNMHLTDLLGQLEVEKRRAEELSQLRKATQGGGWCWWEVPIRKMGLKELEQLKTAMEELRKKVVYEAEKLIMEEASAASPLPPPFVGCPPPGYGGGDGGFIGDYNAPGGLGQFSATSHGYTLVFGRSFF